MGRNEREGKERKGKEIEGKGINPLKTYLPTSLNILNNIFFSLSLRSFQGASLIRCFPDKNSITTLPKKCQALFSQIRNLY